MNPDAAQPSPQRQASSHVALEPVNGLVLYRREAARRDSLLSSGNLATGCGELDDEVLAGGGFERGCVVGVSAEQEDFGLLIGLQTVARLLVASQLATPAAVPRPRAMIITTLDMAALLPTLSGVLEAQAGMLLAGGGEEDPAPVPAVAPACLEQISISRVFDLEGLWEVLQEDLVPNTAPGDAGVPPSPQVAEAVDLDAGGLSAAATSTTQKISPPEPGGDAAEDTSSPPATTSGADEATERSPPPSELRSIKAKTRRAEIMDSEDEISPLSSCSSELSPPPPSPSPPAASPAVEHSDVQQPSSETQEPASSRSSSLSPPPASSGPSDTEAGSPPPQPPSQPTLPATVVQDDKTAGPAPISTTPDVVLVTHMSTLITALFRRRDKQSAHLMLELLASHLRHISRSPEYGCPLVMLLNGTNAPIKAPGEQNQHHHHHHGEDSPPSRFEGDAGGNRGVSGGSQRPLDPTLRSIFNLPYAAEQGYNNRYYYGRRGDNGGDAGVAASAAAAMTRRNKPVYGLVFTQLLDLHLLATLVPRGREDAEAALLAAAGDGGRPARYCWVVEVLLDEVGVWCGAGRPRTWREQRWGVVDVWGGVLVVDAFGGGGGA